MVRRARACAVSRAIDLAHPSRPCCHDRVGTADSHGLARTNGGDSRGAITTKTGGGGAAALELARAGTLVGHGAASAVRSPSTVAAGSVATRRLGAALDVGRVGRAGAVDGGAARGRAGRGGDADAWHLLDGDDGRGREVGELTSYTPRAIARLVKGGKGHRGGQGREEEPAKMHLNCQE